MTKTSRTPTNTELILEKAVTRTQQSELVKKQWELMKSNFIAETAINVDDV